jgi:hypothetical protein
VAAVLTVFGVVGYRFNVCIVAFKRPDVMSYFPTLVELGVSLGIVAGACLLFIFFVEKLRVYPDEHWETPVAKVPSFEPLTTRVMLPHSLAAPRRYSLAFIMGAAVTVVLLPHYALWGPALKKTPVLGPRVVQGLIEKRPGALGNDLEIAKVAYPPPHDAKLVELMIIDGNRNGRLVPFTHDEHVAKLGDKQSCVKCHHANLPYERNSACSECHRDMYLKTDIFDHEAHVVKLGGDAGCIRCHQNPSQVKSRATATPCSDCHSKMVVAGSRIKPPKQGLTGYAVGYMDAMHGLCIGCHEEKIKTEPVTLTQQFSTCTECHRGTNGSELRQMPPYATKETMANLEKRERGWTALRYHKRGSQGGTFNRQ